MRIAVGPSDYTGSGLLRVVSPFKALATRTQDQVDFYDFLEDEVVRSADIVVFQRATNRHQPYWAQRLRERGQLVVHELDDDLHHVPASNPTSTVYYAGARPLDRLQRVIQAAHLSIVSTERMREIYGALNPNTQVCEIGLPDAVVDEYLAMPLSVEPKRRGEIRIGWAGSATHKADIELVIPVLEQIMRAYPQVHFAFGGADYRSLFVWDLRHRLSFFGTTYASCRFTKADIDNPNLSTLSYYRMLREMELDIAIAPLESTDFNLAKSYLKLAEYGMLGIPVIASNWGCYREYWRASQMGTGANPPACMLAKDDRAWFGHLAWYIEEPTTRLSFAETNAAFVDRRHRVSAKVDQWIRALQTLPARVAA